MRTPNAKCIICGKPLYRRPSELARVRYVACMKHRNEAQDKCGITPAQYAGLAKGRKPGTNNRTGYKHRDESKRKIAESNKAFWKEHPDKAINRGKKTRGKLHYRWKGGCSRLNVAVRRLTENRKWMDAVKARDKKCLVCNSTKLLEAHHIVPLAVLISVHGITTQAAARECLALWDLANGITVCRKCHYTIHGRKYED